MPSYVDAYPPNLSVNGPEKVLTIYQKKKKYKNLFRKK